MTDDLNGALKLIDEQIKCQKIKMVGQPFVKQSLIYAFTTENITGYLSKLSLKNKNNALSVLASGDQLFSLATLGFKNVDTFDSNALTSYYALGLKLAALIKYNYQEFLKFFTLVFSTSSLEELNDLINSLLPLMSKKYRLFWQQLLDFNYQNQKDLPKPLNLMQMLLMNKNINPKRCPYLLNAQNYQLAQDNINKMHITFKCLNALDIPDTYHEKYDLILLSNICDYLYKYWDYNWPYSKLKEYTNKLMLNLNSKGVLALAYLIHKYNSYDSSYLYHLIPSSSVTLNSLTNESLINFANISNDSINKTIKDALLLVKKK